MTIPPFTESPLDVDNPAPGERSRFVDVPDLLTHSLPSESLAFVTAQGVRRAVRTGAQMFSGHTVPMSLLTEGVHYEVSAGEITHPPEDDLTFSLSTANTLVTIDLTYPGDGGLCDLFNSIEFGFEIQEAAVDGGLLQAADGTSLELRAVREGLNYFVGPTIYKDGGVWKFNSQRLNSDNLYLPPTPVSADGDLDGERRLRMEWMRNGTAYSAMRVSMSNPDGSRTTLGTIDTSGYHLGGEGEGDKWHLQIVGTHAGEEPVMVTIKNVSYRADKFLSTDVLGTAMSRPYVDWTTGTADWAPTSVVSVEGTQTMTASFVERGFTLQGPATILRAESSAPEGGGAPHSQRFVRTLNATGDDTRGLTVVKDIIFDGQSGGEYLEHAHLFMFGVDGDGSVRPQLHVDGCHFKDAPGDGLYLLCCDAVIENCTAEGSGRADISITHSCRVLYRNNAMGINHETESPGIYPSHISYIDCTMWTAQMGATGAGGTLYVKNVNVDRTLNPSVGQYNVQMEGSWPSAWVGATEEERGELSRNVQVPAFGLAEDCDWSDATEVTVIYPGNNITLRNVLLPSEHNDIAGVNCLWIRFQDVYRQWPNQTVVLEDMNLPESVAVWGNGQIVLNNVTGPTSSPWIAYSQLSVGEAHEVLEIIHGGVSYVITGADGTWSPP